jgi:hypothetical protein
MTQIYEKDQVLVVKIMLEFEEGIDKRLARLSLCVNLADLRQKITYCSN